MSQRKFTEKTLALSDFKLKSIGFQIQIHWISKSNPLDFKHKSIGFGREEGRIGERRRTRNDARCEPMRVTVDERTSAVSAAPC